MQSTDPDKAGLVQEAYLRPCLSLLEVTLELSKPTLSSTKTLPAFEAKSLSKIPFPKHGALVGISWC